MALSQGLHQKLLQKLSPQQIQLMKLLQVPTAFLEERIKEELEDNPALEQGNGSEVAEDDFREEGEVGDDHTDTDPDGSEDEYEQVDISEYVSDSDDDIADYKTRDEYAGGEDKSMPIRSEVSFHDMLIQQLALLQLDERQQIIAEQIVGSIDDDGYLRRDNTAIVNDLAFRQNIETTPEEVESLIELIQQFEPHGICARHLQECLLIQLRIKSKKKPTHALNAAIAIIDRCFDEFGRKHFEKIQKTLHIEADEMREAMQIITKLNPKPGGTAAAEPPGHAVIPDFFVVNNNGVLELTLHNRNAPDLKISDDYKSMLQQYEKGSKKDKRQKEAVLFIKQKIDSARWFIDAIKQRQTTLLLTMNAILEYQHAFFISGDETELRPMILKDIAEKTALDISTVSRVANSKFVQTEFGTFRLKFFFSESISKEGGEEVSTREVKKILLDLIEAEPEQEPLSDDRLTELLQAKGYHIARRTIAKYREQLNIPVARLRKKF